MHNEDELKIEQERSDFQDAKNHSTKLHLVMCISAATSRLLSSQSRYLYKNNTKYRNEQESEVMNYLPMRKNYVVEGQTRCMLSDTTIRISAGQLKSPNINRIYNDLTIRYVQEEMINLTLIYSRNVQGLYIESQDYCVTIT